MYVSHSALRLTALAALLSTAALIHPAYASPAGQQPLSSGPPSSTVMFDSSGKVISETPDNHVPGAYPGQYRNGQQPAPYAQGAQGNGRHPMMANHAPEERHMEVEQRIKHLHDKLQITSGQEQAWGDVAQTMRDSEANVSALIQSRHKSAGNMTAVEDLESYQQIAQAHADGLRKVTNVFSPLYNSMPEAQQKNADKVFSGFEGHGDTHGAMKHHHHKGVAHDNKTNTNK